MINIIVTNESYNLRRVMSLFIMMNEIDFGCNYL